MSDIPPTRPRPDSNSVLQAAVVVGLVAIAIGFIWRHDDANAVIIGTGLLGALGLNAVSRRP